ncbi:hypothetical protein, partial [Escherichia coli]|uniref:hypothetical protein n=1 Tax=Escherichia coli TaxID=562 RepID=UPI001BDDC5DB
PGCGFILLTLYRIVAGASALAATPACLVLNPMSTKTKKARVAGFFSLPALISGIYISVTVALHKV